MRSIVYNNPFRQEIVDEWEKQARASLVGSLSHNLIIFDRSLRSYKDITPVVVTSHADLSEPIEMHNVQHLHVQPVDWQPWAYGAYVFGNAFLFIRRCGNFEEPCRLSQDRLNERGELQQHIFWRHMEQIVDEVTHGLLKKDMQESFEETRNAPFSYFPRDPWEDPVLWARWDQLFPDVPKNDEEHAWRRTLMLNTYLRSQSLTEAMERRAEHVLEGAADFWDDESEEHQAMYYHLARPSRLKPKRKTVD